MDNIQKNENKNKRPVIRYMIYVLLIGFIITGVSFSRYATTLSGKDSARVAAFDYEVTVTDKDGTSLPDAANFATIYATSKLKEANACMFGDDAVTVIRKVTVTNNSEVALHADISEDIKMNNQSYTKGIVWCIFDEDELTALGSTIAEAIMNKLNVSAVADIPDTYDDLVAMLMSANQTTIDSWNADADLDIGSNNERTLTIVFWAEHDGVKAYKTDENLKPEDNSSAQLTLKDFALTFTVTQID